MKCKLTNMQCLCNASSNVIIVFVTRYVIEDAKTIITFALYE